MNGRARIQTSAFCVTSEPFLSLQGLQRLLEFRGGRRKLGPESHEEEGATEKAVWGLVTKKVAVPSSFLGYKAPQTPSIHPNVLQQLRTELSIQTDFFRGLEK